MQLRDYVIPGLLVLLACPWGHIRQNKTEHFKAYVSSHFYFKICLLIVFLLINIRILIHSYQGQALTIQVKVILPHLIVDNLRCAM